MFPLKTNVILIPSGVLQSFPFQPPKQAQLPSHGWHFPWQEHGKVDDKDADSVVKHIPSSGMDFLH